MQTLIPDDPFNPFSNTWLDIKIYLNVLCFYKTSSIVYKEGSLSLIHKAAFTAPLEKIFR